MDKIIKNNKMKKNLMVRFLEWIVRGNKKAAQKGDLCKS